MHRYVAIAILVAMAVAVLGAAAAEQSTPRVEPPCVGIDLGTTYSVVGVWRNGAVDIIPNELGNRITPSVVAFTDTERLVGDGARSQLTQNPSNTVYAIKRLIGRKVHHATVARDAKLLSYTIVAGNDNRPLVEVQYNGTRKRYTPEEVSAMVLQRMKAIAEAFLGTKVENAVVAVPAYFNDAQRQATKDAGTIAGLNVVRIINEPTAAAIAYGLHESRKEKNNILVYDLGGGTFDVSLLTIHDGVFEVIATNGDTHLGGEDFDNRMMAYFVEQLQKKKINIDGDQKALARLRKACEAAKRQLSARVSARVEVDSLMEGFDFSEAISRAKFEELNMDLFNSTLAPMRQVLEDAKLSTTDVDEIVLVGGSTRIPKVQRLVREFFGKEPNTRVNPDEAVAFGAAVHAAILSGEDMATRVVLLDVIPLSLGIETVGGVMTKLIARNSRIPAKNSMNVTTHKDDQVIVDFPVFEGEHPLVQHTHHLGEFSLTGVPPARAGVPQIIVTFEVDENSILFVSTRDVGSDRKAHITIASDRGALPKKEVERMVREAEEFEERVEQQKRAARSALEQIMHEFRTQVNDKVPLGAKLSHEGEDMMHHAAAKVHHCLAQYHCDYGHALHHLREVVSLVVREQVKVPTPAPPVPESPRSEPAVPVPILQPAAAEDQLDLSGWIVLATLRCYAVPTLAVALLVMAWQLVVVPLQSKVQALEAKVVEATARERARARRITKERTDGKKFYDMTLTVAKVEDLVGKGFVLQGGKSASVEAAGSVGLSIVSFLGYFNTGKTSLVARLCETEDSPAGDECHTEGLAVKIAQQAGLKMACVDGEGLATPVTRAADGVSYSGLQQRKTLEDFQRELASEIADCIVFVCDKISYRDQMDVYCLLDNEAIKLGKKVIVVHNLRTVRDVDAMARYQAEVFRMYGANEVQWATVDGPKCSEPIPTGPGPHRLVHTNGHYSQLRQVFLGDEDEPAMRTLNTKAIEWLRTTVAGCAKKRCDFGECVRAGVQRMVSSYVVKLGEKYDVRLVRETSTTDDVQRVVLEWDGDETPTVLPRDVTGLVPRKKAVQNSLTTGDTFYLLTFSVPGVSSKADVTCMSVKAQAMDRILIAFRARSPLVPMSACDDENLAAMTSDSGTRDSKGPKDVVDVDFVSKLPFCTGRFTFGVGGGVVWVRLQKSADFKEEPAPSPHPSAPPPTPPAEAIPAADRLVPS